MMHPSATDDDGDDDDNDDAALDGVAARMWIRDALGEYEQVAALRNAQSLLSNAAAASSASSSTSSSSSSNSSHPTTRRPPPPPDHRADYHRDECDAVVPRTLDAELRRLDLYVSFADYHAAIDRVRRTHASLRSRLAYAACGGGKNGVTFVTTTTATASRRGGGSTTATKTTMCGGGVGGGGVHPACRARQASDTQGDAEAPRHRAPGHR